MTDEYPFDIVTGSVEREVGFDGSVRFDFAPGTVIRTAAGVEYTYPTGGFHVDFPGLDFDLVRAFLVAAPDTGGMEAEVLATYPTEPGAPHDLVGRLGEIAEQRGVDPEILKADVPELCPHELVPATCPLCLRGPAVGSMDHCGACGAAIVWAITEAGKSSPIDAYRDRERGNLVVIGRSLGRPKVQAKNGEDATALRAAGEKLYLSHFASCTSPERFRKRGKK